MMDPDLFLVIGLVIGVLSIPSLLSAFAENRAPRIGSIMALVAGVLVVVAVQKKAGGYQIADIPNVFYSVIGQYVR
jgi:formate-dependent nitrite reductase membrane component NrfD